ncbi:MAG: hypothetical protein ACUZ8O_10565 [Candidatus Anammoxibacter sp.]
MVSLDSIVLFAKVKYFVFDCQYKLIISGIFTFGIMGEMYNLTTKEILATDCDIPENSSLAMIAI